MNEVWKDIPEYEGLYQVSNIGRVRSLPKVNRYNGRKFPEKIMSQRLEKTGYLMIGLHKSGGKKIRFLVHRLVMMAFAGKCPDGLEVNHIDGDKTNNRLENLEYVTRSYNHKHAYDVLGVVKNRGESNGHSKFAEDDVRYIIEAHRNGVSNKELAKQFGVHYNTVQQITHGTRWSHVFDRRTP